MSNTSKNEKVLKSGSHAKFFGELKNLNNAHPLHVKATQTCEKRLTMPFSGPNESFTTPTKSYKGIGEAREINNSLRARFALVIIFWL